MKILVFTASTGGGHKRAAAAFKEYVGSVSPETDVKVVDGIAKTGKAFNGLICGGYTFLAKHMPGFYGSMYRRSDKKSMLNSICNGANKSQGKKLLPDIEEFKPDVILSCHPFVTTMLGDLKTKGLLSVPTVSLITDFAPHQTYIADGIDHYIVSSEAMVETFRERYDIDSSRVHAFGIPVFRKFAEKTSGAKLGFSKDKKTILFMAGSFGVTKVLGVYKDIVLKNPGCQFIVITGNNKQLFDNFKPVVTENTRLLMFVDNVEDYMHAADLIITKPGGLTVSESLVCELPMAIYSAYPGQEEDNAKFLSDSGAAIILGKYPGETIRALIDDEIRLSVMKRNCKLTCCGNASEKLFNLCRELAKDND